MYVKFYTFEIICVEAMFISSAHLTLHQQRNEYFNRLVVIIKALQVKIFNRFLDEKVFS